MNGPRGTQTNRHKIQEIINFNAFSWISSSPPSPGLSVYFHVFVFVVCLCRFSPPERSTSSQPLAYTSSPECHLFKEEDTRARETQNTSVSHIGHGPLWVLQRGPLSWRSSSRPKTRMEAPVFVAWASAIHPMDQAARARLTQGAKGTLDCDQAPVKLGWWPSAQ